MPVEKISLPLLDHVRIASPCSARWEQMEGDDRRRYCSTCRLHVYNLAEMERADAERLLRSSGETGLCVRLYRRQDGTVLTRDCPRGQRLARYRWLRGAAALLSCLVSGVAMAAGGTRLSRWADAQHCRDTLTGRTLAPHMGEVMLGSVAPAPPNPPGGEPAEAPVSRDA